MNVNSIKDFHKYFFGLTYDTQLKNQIIPTYLVADENVNVYSHRCKITGYENIINSKSKNTLILKSVLPFAINEKFHYVTVLIKIQDVEYDVYYNYDIDEEEICKNRFDGFEEEYIEKFTKSGDISDCGIVRIYKEDVYKIDDEPDDDDPVEDEPDDYDPFEEEDEGTDDYKKILYVKENIDGYQYYDDEDDDEDDEDDYDDDEWYEDYSEFKGLSNPLIFKTVNSKDDEYEYPIIEIIIDKKDKDIMNLKENFMYLNEKVEIEFNFTVYSNLNNYDEKGRGQFISGTLCNYEFKFSK